MASSQINTSLLYQGWRNSTSGLHSAWGSFGFVVCIKLTLHDKIVFLSFCVMISFIFCFRKPSLPRSPWKPIPMVTSQQKRVILWIQPLSRVTSLNLSPPRALHQNHPDVSVYFSLLSIETDQYSYVNILHKM